MDSLQECPSRAEWQEILEGRFPDASADDCTRHLESCGRCQAVVEGLTGSNRTWLNIVAGLRQPPAELPAAGLRALEKIRSNSAPGRRPAMTPRIYLERMMHRTSIAVADESAVAYTLVKLIPSGLAGGRPMRLNLALALDVSGSMYEEDGTGVSRLQRVQDAALDALHKLRPDDTLAVIAFGHNALVLLPPTPVAEKGRIEDILRRIDRFDVDPGGTAMDEGLALALGALEKETGAGKLSQLVVLTDGETSGEQNCRALARQAADRKIPLTLMGVGLDWKASLIKDLAHLSGGKWHYIDVQQARETTRIFAEEFETLAATAFLDVEIHLRPMKDVGVKRVRQVVPEIRDVPLEEPEERHLVARLGTLQHDVSSRYILDLNLPRRADGKYVMAQLELTYDVGTGRRESSGPFPLEVNYTAAGHGYINAEVMKHIDEIRLKEMSDTLQIALQNNDQQAAQHAAEEMVKQGELMGKRAEKKTKIAMQVLDELNVEGVVRKKTQLELDNAARTAEVPS
jgi:Ca-activated chloride channel family protein